VTPHLALPFAGCLFHVTMLELLEQQFGDKGLLMYSGTFVSLVT
jgi:hypothetical protein